MHCAWCCGDSPSPTTQAAASWASAAGVCVSIGLLSPSSGSNRRIRRPRRKWCGPDIPVRWTARCDKLRCARALPFTRTISPRAGSRVECASCAVLLAQEDLRRHIDAHERSTAETSRTRSTARHGFTIELAAPHSKSQVIVLHSYDARRGGTRSAVCATLNRFSPLRRLALQPTASSSYFTPRTWAECNATVVEQSLQYSQRTALYAQRICSWLPTVAPVYSTGKWNNTLSTRLTEPMEDFWAWFRATTPLRNHSYRSHLRRSRSL
mmetsp:Transcript_1338/g.4368  ORF Transcript_1338/g.4368 Transcript_1338/m.4368 type:complete len:267 (-) Transcript_1338:219-1019(-)